MKYVSLVFMLLVFGCNHSGSNKGKSEVKTTIDSNVQTVAVELTIQGMTCTGCEQTIQAGIRSIKGVKQVKATFTSGKAYVEFIPEVADTMAMKQKVTSSGYVIAGIKTIPLDSLRSKL